MRGEVSGGGLGEVDSELGLCGRLLGRPEPVPCDIQSVQAIATHYTISIFISMYDKCSTRLHLWVSLSASLR